MERLFKRLFLLLIGFFVLPHYISVAQMNLTVVYPLYGSSNMELKWGSVPGTVQYEIRKKEEGGVFTGWSSVGIVTTIVDGPLDVSKTYIYQVRAKINDTTFHESKERRNSFTKVWPVRQQGDCSTESIEILHGFGQPIGAGGSNYFHEGVDINGETSNGAECVKAPLGAIVVDKGGSGSNIFVNLQVSIGGNIRYIQFNHLKNLNAKLANGQSVAPGDSLGFINDGVASWTTLSSHTHCHFWSTYANLFGTSINPFTIWEDSKYRDPQEKSPEVMDSNGDGESLRFRKTPNLSDYFAKDKPIHNASDIVVEAVDKQSSDEPWQVPKEVGYYIQKFDGVNWADAVKSSASPFILVDNNIYYNSNSSSSNPGVVNTIIDYNISLKGTAPNTPATYSWSQWFTYIVTNTKGTGGALTDLDSNQCWATDARDDVAEDNGYKAAYHKARVIDEAKFPDGKFRVHIRLKDYVNTPADYQKEVEVDNFRPYVKKVEMKSAEMNYSAEWEWKKASAQLEFKPYTEDKKACGKMEITITMSEPMKQVELAIPSLGFSHTSNTAEANTNNKIFKFEVPEDKTKNAKEGPHKLEIGGKDMADNDVQGFTSTANIPAANIQKRKIDATWEPNTAVTKDTIHKFKIEDLSKKIKLSKKDVTCHDKKDGEISVTMEGGKAPFTYTWNPAVSNSDKASNLGPGTYKVTVKDANGCTGEKDTTITEPSKLTLSVSGGGTHEFCQQDGPPNITLTASASGGTPDYNYSWPGGSITVSASGTFTANVTDKNGCTESATVQVIVVPIVCSRDPNDIVGPDGYGPEKFVAKKDVLPYTIRFENDPKFATAPAQIVKINHPLDNHANIFSLRLGDFGFGKFVFQVPPDRTFYSTRLDVIDSLGVVVDITAGIDVTKKEAFWIFESLDPKTGLPPTDALLGFLLVNDTTTRVGEGYVSYSIKPSSSSKTGDTIYAEAKIVFDINEPILTPIVFNTIDAVTPTSKMKSLPSVSTQTTFDLHWDGKDDIGGSGISKYDLFVSANDGPFEIYKSNIVDTVTSFTGDKGSKYEFFTLAIDNVGNVENLKSVPDATTTIFATPDTNRVPVITYQGDPIDQLSLQGCSGNIGIKQCFDIFDQDKDSLTYTVLQSGQNGNFSLSGNSAKACIEYTPYDGFAGDDQISFMVCDPDGACDTIKVNYTIKGKPVVNISTVDSTIFCQGEYATIAAYNQKFITYQWRKDGVNISGANQSTFQAVLSGEYSLEVSDSNECKATSNGIYIQTITCEPYLIQPVHASVNNPKDLMVVSSEVIGATSYSIELWLDTLFSGSPEMILGPANSHDVTGLKEYKTYYVRVRTDNMPEGKYGPVRWFSTGTLPVTYMITPSNASNEVSIYTSFIAEKRNEFEEYIWEFSSDSMFISEGVILTSSSTFIKPFDQLRFGKKYFVRIKGNITSKGITGNWGPVKSFTMENGSAYAFIESPKAASLNNPVNLYVISKSVPGANEYRIELSKDSTFTSGPERILGPSKSNYITGLHYNSDYFGRVRTDNMEEGTYGPIIKFVTIESPVTYLTSPTNGSTNVSVYKTMFVLEQGGVEEYQWEFNTDSTFGSFTALTKKTQENSIKLPGELGFGTKYFVRIKAGIPSIGMNGDWGPIRKFATEDGSRYAYITSPNPNSVNNSTTVWVKANSVPGATAYQVELWTDSTFSSVPFKVLEPEALNKVVGLLQNQKFFARVRTNNMPIGVYGPVKSFSTGSSAREAFEEELPLQQEIAVYPNPTENMFYISLPEESIIKMLLYDVNGKLLLTKVTQYYPEVEVDISSFAGGVYTLKLFDMEGKVFKVIMVNKL